MIVAGWSAYPRQLDFARFREIADSVGAYLMVDMAHFAGLVAAGLHPIPVPHRRRGHDHDPQDDRRRPRRDDPLQARSYAKKIDSAVFPGQQGGPLEHVIAGKAVALRIAASEAFRERQERTLAGARAVAERAARRRRRRQRADRRHRRAPGPVRPARVRARRQAGRGPPALDRDHRQPQRGAVRPAAAGGLLRAADRLAGAGHPRAAGRGLRRGRRGSSPRRSSRATSRRGERSWRERVQAIAERYPLYAGLGAAAAV